MHSRTKNALIDQASKRNRNAQRQTKRDRERGGYWERGGIERKGEPERNTCPREGPQCADVDVGDQRSI